MKKEYLLSIVCMTAILLSCSSTKKERTTESISEYSEVSEVSVSQSGYEAEYSSNHVKESKMSPPVIDSEMSSAIAEDREMVMRDEIYESKSEADESSSSDKSVVRKGGKQQRQRANLLTATEVNDFKKWDEWEELLDQDFSQYKNTWKFIPKQRFVARASDKRQRPIVDATVKLYDSRGNLVWNTRTDNTGTAQLWANVFLAQNNQQQKFTAPFKIEFTYRNEQKTIENAQPYPQQTNVVKMNTDSRLPNDVDIFFIVDATDSMGDELHYLQTELLDIINQVKANQANLNLRMGSLVYRDHGDDYLTRKSSLNSDISKTIRFLEKQSAGGGGDEPEAVDEALYQSIELESWKSTALSRIAFLILDAPPHQNNGNIRRMQQQITIAASKGIRLVPLVASGMDQEGEYLMRSLALTTNGTYVTLTDDSGVGNAHAKPTTDYYRVEKLNDLIIRLITDYTTLPQTQQ